jgi:hypothetical protein
MAHEETDCPHFPSDCCTSQVIVGKGTHAGPGLGEGANQPNVHKHDTIYARIKPFFLALILTHGPIRFPGGENFCGHQQYKQAGENKPQKNQKQRPQPFFPLFQVLDQSGCRVEIIFVTTNSLLKQAKKKKKREKRKFKYPFLPLFQLLDQSGCRVERIFVSTNSLPTQAKKKTNKPLFP